MDYFITLNDKSIDAIGEAVEKPITVIDGLKEDIADLEQTVAQKDEIIADKDEEIEALEQQIANGYSFRQAANDHIRFTTNLTSKCMIGCSDMSKNTRFEAVNLSVNKNPSIPYLGVYGSNQDAPISNYLACFIVFSEDPGTVTVSSGFRCVKSIYSTVGFYVVNVFYEGKPSEFNGGFTITTSN